MKRKFILIVFLICVIILGMLVYLLKTVENKYQVNKVETEAEVTFEKLAQNEYKHRKIVPQNFTPIMREYYGEVETESWYTHIYRFVDSYIPEIQESDDLLSYYTDNSSDIEIDLGINSYEDFEKLANQVKTISKSATFQDSEFDVTDINVTDESLVTKLKIFFTNDEELNLKFVIYNEIEDEVEISILAE